MDAARGPLLSLVGGRMHMATVQQSLPQTSRSLHRRGTGLHRITQVFRTGHEQRCQRTRHRPRNLTSSCATSHSITNTNAILSRVILNIASISKCHQNELSSSYPAKKTPRGPMASCEVFSTVTSHSPSSLSFRILKSDSSESVHLSLGLPRFRIPMSLNYRKQNVLDFRDTATSAAKNKLWRVLIKPKCVSDSPRAAAVAEFRLLTGHDCLCGHLYPFNLTDSPFYVLLDKSWTLLI
ncbi:hypothetical protein TNCV_104981 [Trichonephila clavipes]|nr:hypothetical protein TNCV_104981 [Trichonephila clavipes]